MSNAAINRYPVFVVLLTCAVGLGPKPAPAADPPGPDTLTENAAGSWDWDLTVGGSSTITDDTSRVRVGSYSLKYDTTGGFDTWLWSPVARNAHWDFTDVARIRFWVYAINENLGFQSYSPWVRVGTTTSDYWEYKPPYDVLNDARNNWLEIDIPLAGDSFWQRTEVGSNGVADINYIEIHADTWDAGFTLWFDGLTFDTTPPLPDGLMAVAGDSMVALEWLPYTLAAGFDHFAVYRRTTPFTSVAGLTPIATIPDPGATAYDDTTAVNGTSYHYAVTVVSTGGSEETSVASVGPRTPRHETDLHVLYIERTPRYPRYAPIYTYYEITEPSGFGPYWFSAATGLGQGQTGATQRFPDIGDTVTYTAHIRNRGTTTITGPVNCTWRYDDGVIATPTIPGPLAPGDSASTAMTRTWDGLSHDISFTIDTTDDKALNNSLTDNTNAVPFLTYVDRTYEEAHREETPSYPQATTEDFVHWLHLHMAEMNRMFADAGSDKRIRFDKLDVLHDHDPDPTIDTIDFAVFPFRYYAGGGSLRAGSGYYHADVDIDYGLLHEKGHQLGLVDIYRLDMNGANNQVSGMGYSAVPCLMHGCSDFFSDHSALAMNHWYDVAHGYYGQYMYCTPNTVRMRFIGIDGQPLQNATVKMYQKVSRSGQGEVITTQIKAQGTTDVNGEWDLPNVPIDTNLAPTTYAGDTLRPNPFGYIAVVADNGLLHFRIEKLGGVDYAWLDITEVNVAYWQGQTGVAVFERQVAVGGPPQFVPPPDMTELNAYDWTAWAQGSDPQNTYVEDETSAGLHPVGEGSIKFVTDGGFDTSIRYPATVTAQWDVSGANYLNIHLRTENPNLGFQSGSPWIRLMDADNNYFQYQYYSGSEPTNKLNETRGVWRSYSIPLNAPSPPTNGWGRTTNGSPSLSDIHYIEIHADTWDSGFIMWVDGLSFDPQPYCHGDGNYDSHIDLADFAMLQACYSGQGTCAAAGCEAFDWEGDCDVDDVDYAQFAAGITGPLEHMDQCD